MTESSSSRVPSSERHHGSLAPARSGAVQSGEVSKRQELNTRLNRLDIDWAERRRELSYVNSRGVRSEPRRAALVALSILSVLAALGTGVALFVGFVEVVPFAAIFFLGALVQAIRYKRTLARYEDAKSRYQRERAALVEQLAPSPLA